MPRKMTWSDKAQVDQWLSARSTRNPIVEYLRDGFDFGDVYGSTLSCMFAIADVISDIDPALVPDSWEFRKSLAGSDTESWEYRAILECMKDEGATMDDLERAARIFERIDSLNRSTGIAY